MARMQLVCAAWALMRECGSAAETVSVSDLAADSIIAMLASILLVASSSLSSLVCGEDDADAVSRVANSMLAPIARGELEAGAVMSSLAPVVVVGNSAPSSSACRALGDGGIMVAREERAVAGCARRGLVESA